jgi:hypothetical protein
VKKDIERIVRAFFLVVCVFLRALFCFFFFLDITLVGQIKFKESIFRLEATSPHTRDTNQSVLSAK